MKLCYISTYPPMRCGIADYTKNLCEALLKTGRTQITVAAEYGSSPYNSEKLSCIPCFIREGGYAENILKVVNVKEPDIVHVQHDYSVYGLNDQFFSLLSKINSKIAVTMHEVHTPNTPSKISYRLENLSRNHRILGEVSAKIIVHSNTMSRWLINYGVDERKITVIPHGTMIMPLRDASKAKESLGYSEKDRVILSFGFIRHFKNDRLLISALREVIEKVQNVKLILVGGLHPYSSKQDEEEAVQRRSIIKHLRLGRHIKLIERYVSSEETSLLFSSADAVVFLHNQPFIEVSGALHLAIGAGKPIVATKIPRFEEIEGVTPQTLISPDDKENLVELLLRILTNRNFANECGERVAKYANLTCWSRVAEQHCQLYKGLSTA